MKKLYFLLFAPILSFSAQIEGTWKLAPQPGALAVGDAGQGAGNWWSNSAGDVTARACLFDDSIKFEANGTMTHYMNGSTWLESWQGSNPEACGAPVAPHVGGAATYAYDATAGTLTVNGLGAHIGLAKVVNGGEISTGAAVASSITYLVQFSNGGNTMTADINFGPGWWRFVYQRTVPLAVQDYQVTFRVNMSQYSGTTSGVFLNGNFNNWCGNCNPMNNLGNGNWELTLPLTPGAIEYKFTADGIWENMTDGSPCTLTTISGNDTYVNRSNTIIGDVTFPNVCWESCDICTNDITFKVDMNDYISAGGSTADGVFLNGNFNNWCGSCTPMIDANNDNIWEVTAPIGSGAIEYKFTVGGWNDQEMFVGGEPCTITDPSGQYTNRSYTVTAAATLPEVCWESCSDCLAGVEEIANAVSLYPNPVNSVMTIKAAASMTAIQVLDLSGKVVAQFAGNGLTQEINVDSLKAGIYTIQITTAAGTSAKQFVKK